MAAGAARLLELAFDPRVEGHDDPMSQRILDAALDLVAASGFRHLTMDEVAARARVGRMTVYRHFGSRQQLTDALSVRECRRCLNEIAASLDPSKPIADRAADLFVATLRVIREHPLLERLARVEPEALLYELNRDGSAVFRLVREFVVALIVVAQDAGEFVSGDPEPIAEVAVRLGASFVLMPDSVIATGDDELTRETIKSLIAPVLKR